NPSPSKGDYASGVIRRSGRVHNQNSHSRDGGCTRPNCLQPGYHCEVHHSPDWTPHGATDADKLFFACGPDHKRVTDGHYHQPHRHWPPGLDRRHHTTRHQPRPPPRRNSSTATPTHPTTTRSERTQRTFDQPRAHRGWMNTPSASTVTPCPSARWPTV